MGFDLQNSNADTLIAKVMKQFDFKHQYQVAEYFGVTAQTLSGWVKSGVVPDKYLIKFQLDIQDLQKKEIISEQSDSNNQKEIVNQKFSKSQSNLNEFSFTIFFANHIKSLVIIPFIFSILSLILVFFIFRPVYTSSAKILPIGDSGSSFSEMAGMASQLGLSMPMNFGNEIPWDEMFPEIIKSENLVQSILNEKFSSNKYGKNKSLHSIIKEEYNIKNKSAIFLEKMLIYEFNEMI